MSALIHFIYDVTVDDKTIALYYNYFIKKALNVQENCLFIFTLYNSSPDFTMSYYGYDALNQYFIPSKEFTYLPLSLDEALMNFSDFYIFYYSNLTKSLLKTVL